METERPEDPKEGQPLANSFEIPGEVQQRFGAGELRAEAEKLRRDLREGIAEIRTPAFLDLAGLFTEFAAGLCLLAVRANPPASFGHPDRHFAFLTVWLPMWVKDEALKEWNASVPPGLNELLSNFRNRQRFRDKIDGALRRSIEAEKQSNPFGDSSIDKRIKAKVLRLQSASLEWTENPAGTCLDEHILASLVGALNAHAEGYLSKVVHEDLIPAYANYLRGVGSALIRNAEQRSHLSDPYTDDRLRKMAENSGTFMNRVRLLPPEKREAEIRDEVERLRSKVMPEALRWNGWKNQLFVRIDTQFEARYRWWEAEAIQRLQPIPEKACHTRLAVVEPLQPQPTPVMEGPPTPKAPAWEDIEISFLSEERVQIRIGSQTETRNYGEMGFASKKNGAKVAAWETFQQLAAAGGSYRIAADSQKWAVVEKRIQEIRRILKSLFGLADDPLPFTKKTRRNNDVFGYRAKFKIFRQQSYDS